MIDWSTLRTRVVFEDDAVVVLDKPSGISVTGERHETDVVELAAEAGETLWPAHRIDKVTSGVVLFAKTLDVHAHLARQFTKRTTTKTYLAITRSTGFPDHATIDLPLSEGRKSRVRIGAERSAIAWSPTTSTWSVNPDAVFADKRTYPSTTHLARFAETDTHTALAARPVTGRRHQLRVHLAWVGHPIEGDPLFDRHLAPEARTHLHAWQLTYAAAWADGALHTVRADPDDGFWAPFAATASPADLLMSAERSKASLPGSA